MEDEILDKALDQEEELIFWQSLVARVKNLPREQLIDELRKLPLEKKLRLSIEYTAYRAGGDEGLEIAWELDDVMPIGSPDFDEDEFWDRWEERYQTVSLTATQLTGEM